MRIVIDGRLWFESGIGRYIRNLILELQNIDTQNEYYILHLKKDYDSLVYHNANFHKVLANFRWYGFSEQLVLPRLLKSLKPDLVHFPHFNVPYLYQGKYIVTIHDLIHQHFQMKRATTHDPLTYKIKKLGYHRVFARAVTKSLKILTPSEFVKGQIIKEWRIGKNKIIVTPEGVDENFLNLIQEAKDVDFKKVAEKFNIQKPYIFYVGNAHPHKNIPRLIESFLIFQKKHPEYSLILSGPDNYFWQQTRKSSSIESVIFTGFVSEKELVMLYKNAQVFVMPSMEEGFGIPVLEAMACSCPVVSSNAASLPEVGGNAVLYFNPKDENEIIEKMEQITEDEKTRESLTTKGLKRYKDFSWQKMAQQTLKVYQENT